MTVPEPLIQKDVATLPGLDHRKMSKSYNNTINLFVSDDDLFKQIKKFTTDSVAPGETREPEDVPIYKLIEAVATPQAAKLVAKNLGDGNIRWGDIKEQLFEQIKLQFGPARERYTELQSDLEYVEKVLAQGAIQAQEQAKLLMEQVRIAVGLR